MLLWFSLRDAFVLWIVRDSFHEFLKFFRVSFVRSSYIENIYLAFILLRCPLLILVHVPLSFIMHCVILKKGWKCQYFSLIYVICHLLFFQSIWYTGFFLFSSLLFTKNIEVFLMQSVNFSLKPFMFLASCNSFCVLLFRFYFSELCFSLIHSWSLFVWLLSNFHAI